MSSKHFEEEAINGFPNLHSQERVDGYGNIMPNEVDDIINFIDHLSERVEFKHGRTALLFDLIDTARRHVGEGKP